MKDVKDVNDDHSKERKDDNSKKHSKDSASTPDKGNWTEQKAKLKAKYPTLTDADFHFVAGKKDQMLAKIQTKLGKTKEEFHKIMEKL